MDHDGPSVDAQRGGNSTIIRDKADGGPHRLELVTTPGTLVAARRNNARAQAVVEPDGDLVFFGARCEYDVACHDLNDVSSPWPADTLRPDDD